MQGENRPRVPFDDRAALEELERLQRSIQEYRRRREEAEGAFEEFVGSFRKPAAQGDAAGVTSQSAPVPGGQGAAVAASGAGAPVVRPPADPPQPVVAGVAAPASAPPAPVVTMSAVSAAPPPVATTPAPPPAVAVPDTFFSDSRRSLASEDAPADNGAPETDKRATRSRLPLVLAAAAVLLIAAVLLTRSRTSPVEPSPAPATVETPAAAPPSAPVVPPAEIRALRRVWVRVIVDGNREVERELEADARVPLPAGRTFVIRAGDAGAIRFLLKGQDQGPLGSDAQVVTRTFTAPER